MELREELQIERYNADTHQLKARMIGEAYATVDIEFRGEQIVVAMAYFE